MQRPSLLPVSPDGESHGGYNYHLDGGLVPALTVELQGTQSIYFEHHTLLWKTTGIQIGIKKLSGIFKRMFAGMPILMTQASGKGAIAFSRDGVGQIFPLHLKRGQEVDIREHQFLAATDSVEYTFERVKGITNILWGGTGYFIDKFIAKTDDGIVWLYGYGNVFEVTLAAGEQIDVEPSAWLYKDPSVKMNTIITNLSTGLFGGSSFTLNSFTGPGKIGIQSMSIVDILGPQAAGTTSLADAGVMGLAGAAVKLFRKD